MIMTCQNCVFFFDYDHKTWGECHKRSPNLTICDEGNNAMWPSVEKLNWCGEFIHKVVKEIKVGDKPLIIGWYEARKLLGITGSKFRVLVQKGIIKPAVYEGFDLPSSLFNRADIVNFAEGKTDNE